MKRSVIKLFTALILIAAGSMIGYAQGIGSSLSGDVVDQSGGVIPGADVTVKNDATGAEFKTITADNGTFAIPSLSPGTYTATVSVPNFKQAVIKEIKLVAGTPSTVRVTMEVGGSSETVVVQAGAEVVQSATANITTTLAVNQITNLPLATRNAMDFLVMLPGVNTTGGARGSTVSGLPNNAINITIDGINTQDNYLKGSSGGDGFFSLISPRLDAIEEVTVSTATPGSEAAGQGAVQIRFVTRSGNNEYHGSLYEYHRNPALNSNYWFNNRDKDPTYNGTSTPCTPEQLVNEWEKCKAPRDRVLFNQFGFRAGGPISLPKWLLGPLGFDGRDKAFFFLNYEEFRLPAQRTRTRTIFNPLVDQGIFLYTASGATVQKDLLALAAANGQTATMDPTIQKLLGDIRQVTGEGSVKQQTNPALMDFLFTNKGLGVRKFVTSRFDFNLTSQHRLEGSYTFHRYVPGVDMLNNVDPAYPGFPNFGTQGGNRFTMSTALRSTLTPRIVNEARFGLVGGVTLWYPDVNPGQYAGTAIGNQDGFALGISAAGIYNAYRTTSPSRRSVPNETIEDTLTWTRGAHSLSFGGSWTNIGMWTWGKTQVPTIGFGVDTTYDPARVMFDSTNGPKNFPGASSTQLTSARNIYAVLTGRVTSISGSGTLSEIDNKYTYNGDRVQRGHMREMGFFAADSWRMRPGLTLNFGLRWEFQLPFVPLNSVYTWNTLDDLWGLSGIGNIFSPGTLTGRAPQYIQYKAGDPAYDVSYKALAPSFGFAWSPNLSDSWLSRILGSTGQTVLRGGYSIAYNRNGMSDYTSMFSANPGMTVNATRNVSNGNLVTGTETWPVLFRDKSRLGPPSFATEPAYPLTSTSISDQVNVFDPNTRTPYTQSWTFGIQRELTKDMALEVRYVGTRNLQGWTQRDLNEENIVESGFLEEFKLAMSNLQANQAAGRGNNFKYYGAGTGTSPLPITLAYFSGVPAAQASDISKYTSSNFTSTTFVNTLAKTNPNPYSYEASLWSDSTRRTNALNAGLPANLFVVNPTVASGGAWLSTNGGYNHYDSVVVELRRRLSKGLLVQGSYVFAKALNGSRASFRTPYVKVLGDTLPHAFKVNWVYELPFGRGKMLFGGAGTVVDRVVGGWELQGTGRLQSGNLLNFGNVQLVGMNLEDLRSAYGLRFDDASRLIFVLPQDIIDNTIKAYNVSATTADGYSTTYGAPTGRYIAPANSAGCIQVVNGDCAPYNNYVRGPKFTRFDMSLVKRIRFTESKNFELRAEFLNAFNNINFYGVSNPGTSQTWGQVSSAYTDPNQQQDPGGRLVQIVLRINF